MTYEMTCKAHNELNEHENNLPKDLTLKTLEDNSSESSNDNDFELLTIKLKNFMNKKSKNKNKLKKNTTTCYEYKKKRALKVYWDETSASKVEVANYALVAFGNKVSDLTKTPLLYYEIT